LRAAPAAVTRSFKAKGFARFARCVGMLDSALCRAVQEMERGLVDAELGGGIVK